MHINQFKQLKRLTCYRTRKIVHVHNCNEIKVNGIKSNNAVKEGRKEKKKNYEIINRGS